MSRLRAGAAQFQPPARMTNASTFFEVECRPLSYFFFLAVDFALVFVAVFFDADLVFDFVAAFFAMLPS